MKKDLTINDYLSLARSRGFDQDTFMKKFTSSHLTALRLNGVIIIDCKIEKTEGEDYGIDLR